MKSLVRPELPTASVGSSQATTDAEDNSAPSVTRPQSTCKSRIGVQTSGAASPYLTAGSNVGNEMQAHPAARLGDLPGSGLLHAGMALAAARKCKSRESKAQ